MAGSLAGSAKQAIGRYRDAALQTSPKRYGDGGGEVGGLAAEAGHRSQLASRGWGLDATQSSTEAACAEVKDGKWWRWGVVVKVVMPVVVQHKVAGGGVM